MGGISRARKHALGWGKSDLLQDLSSSLFQILHHSQEIANPAVDSSPIASSSSPLKWTPNVVDSGISPLERTLAVTQGLKSLAGKRVGARSQLCK